MILTNIYNEFNPSINVLVETIGGVFFIEMSFMLIGQGNRCVFLSCLTLPLDSTCLIKHDERMRPNEAVTVLIGNTTLSAMPLRDLRLFTCNDELIMCYYALYENAKTCHCRDLMFEYLKVYEREPKYVSKSKGVTCVTIV